MADWKTPTETLIAAVERVDDVAACVVAMRHHDGSFTYMVPAEQSPVESLGLIGMTQETMRWEIQRNLDVS